MATIAEQTSNTNAEKTSRLAKEPKDKSETGEKTYLSGTKLAIVIVALCTACFLVALDGTIIATAIPTITSHFQSLGDVAWYNSAYLLTTSAFQLPYGRAYSLLSTKWTFLSSIVIFEIGSAVCGAAPTSIALILGRAIQGLGGAGIFSGCFIVLSDVCPLRKRSLFTGFLGAMFGIASVVGPLLGGAFTDSVSWRWCFYINLPLGAIALVVVFFCLPDSDKQIPDYGDKKMSLWQKVSRFDPIGTLILMPSIVCLLLALQWGGSIYPFSDGRIMALFVCFGLSIIAWAAVQYFAGENATIPWSVASQRSVAGATLYTLLGSASFTVVVYYLPIWFQAIKGNSAVESGIHSLPLILSVVPFAIAAGGAVVAVGYYTPFLFLGSVCMGVGGGLLTLLRPDSGVGPWIGYSIIFGAGVGMSLEQCNIAVQTVLPDDKIPAGVSLMVFTRSLGGALSASVGQNVLEQQLRAGLSLALPSLNANIVSGSGATDLISNVRAAAGGDESAVHTVLAIYNHALTRVFLVAAILGCLTLLPAFAVEWKSVKKEKREKQDTTAEEKPGEAV